MVRKSDFGHVWSDSKRNSPTVRSNVGGAMQHLEDGFRSLPPDWRRLNTIEIAGLLDEPGSNDDFQDQLRRLLANKLENSILHNEPLLG